MKYLVVKFDSRLAQNPYMHQAPDKLETRVQTLYLFIHQEV